MILLQSILSTIFKVNTKTLYRICDGRRIDHGELRRQICQFYCADRYRREPMGSVEHIP